LCHLPSLIAAAPAVAWDVIARSFTQGLTWPLLIAEVAVCLAIYFTSFAAFGLTRFERIAVKEQILLILGRGGARGRAAHAAIEVLAQ
jgi:hypothetical protein